MLSKRARRFRFCDGSSRFAPDKDAIAMIALIRALAFWSWRPFASCFKRSSTTISFTRSTIELSHLRSAAVSAFVVGIGSPNTIAPRPFGLTARLCSWIAPRTHPPAWRCARALQNPPRSLLALAASKPEPSFRI